MTNIFIQIVNLNDAIAEELRCEGNHLRISIKMKYPEKKKKNEKSKILHCKFIKTRLLKRNFVKIFVKFNILQCKTE
jgi:hypothetical protein